MGEKSQRVIKANILENTSEVSEEKYRLLVENSANAIAFFDMNCNYLFMNKISASMLNGKPEDYIGKSLHDVFPKELADKFKKRLKDIMESGVGAIFEEIVDPLDHRWLSSNLQPVRDKNGSILGIQAISHDITERKKTEEELKQKSEQQDALLSSIPAFVYYKDTESKLIAANKAFSKMVNVPMDQLVGKTAYDLFPKEQAEHFHIDDKMVMESGKSIINIEEKFTDAEGEIRWASTSKIPYFGDKGQVTGMVGITNDITERKKAEEETKKAKVQMENYLDIAGTMLATTDDKENITLMNKKGYEILGYREGELIGKNWFDTLIPERIRNEIRDVYNQLMSGDIKPVEYYENSLLTKDGEERIIAFHNTVVGNPENKILGVLLSGEDITERKKTEEKIIRAKNHLQNVIDAASEVIVAFDESNRVITWNKTAERITGYTQKQVAGKHIKKLKIFDDPQVIIDAIKNLRKEHKPLINDIIFNTKEGYKKIIKPSYSIIKSRDAETAGVLISGEDVTYDSKHHGKILRGNSYLISDKNNKSAITLFVGLTRFNYNGLFITRSNSEMIKSMIPSAKIQVELLSQDKLGGLDNIADLEKLESKIKGFSTKHKDSLILLDRIDYLITHFSFEEFMKSLYQINNIVSSSSSILLLHLNPSIVDARQLAIIEDELQRLPSQKIEDVQLDEELFEILKFIIQQNQLNTLVTFSQISQQFSIVRETVRKRLRTLENKELITINKQGRKKTLYASEKGKTLLHKRKDI